MGGIYEGAVEMGPSTIMYLPSFVNIGSVIKKLIGVDSQTHTQQSDPTSLLYFFKIRKES
jgi:hypothetical protein